MHKGLIDFKKEVEQELLTAKYIWVNSFTGKFLAASPIPGIAEHATGYFINQTDISIGGRSFTFGLTKKNEITTKRSSTFTTKRYTNDRKAVITRKIFNVKNPYDKISITNSVFYNIAIEGTGWKNIGPYKPFQKANKISVDALHRFLKDKNKKYGYLNVIVGDEILNYFAVADVNNQLDKYKPNILGQYSTGNDKVFLKHRPRQSNIYK